MHLHPLPEQIEQVKGQPNVLRIAMEVEYHLVASLLMGQVKTWDVLH
jgi:hypothetical protein